MKTQRPGGVQKCVYTFQKLEKECRLRARPKPGYSSKSGFSCKTGYTRRLGWQKWSCYVDEPHRQHPSESRDRKCLFQICKVSDLINPSQIWTRESLAALMHIFYRCKFPPLQTALQGDFCLLILQQPSQNISKKYIWR